MHKNVLKIKLFYISVVALLLSSCNSNKVKFNNKFVKVFRGDRQLNAYFFDFNRTIIFTEKDDKVVLNDESGYKIFGKLKDGAIQFDNGCKIKFHEDESIEKICKTEQYARTVKYWPIRKVKEYLSSKQYAEYKEYINSSVSSLTDGYYTIPDSEWLNEADRARINQEKKAQNPYYPFMSFGDFNGDGILPDIAVIATNQALSDLYKSENTMLFVFHAGIEKPVMNTDIVYPWIEDENIFNNTETAETGKQIKTYKSSSEMSSLYWNGDEYENK